jgi:serine/threonine-protein kinase
VLDFGIAKAVPTDTMEAHTHSGAILGTPFYMSPEQARDSGQADPRSDLWSVAVIAYECLVGRRPFDSESLPALSVQILVDPIPVPSEHADVPPGFDAWFARATQRDPNARWQSARELTQALAAALGLDALSEASLPMPVPARRRPGHAVWIVVAAAVVLAGGGAWLATRDDPSPAVVEQDATPEPTPARTPPAEPERAAPAEPAVLEREPPPPGEPPRPARKRRPSRTNVDDLEF